MSQVGMLVSKWGRVLEKLKEPSDHNLVEEEGREGGVKAPWSTKESKGDVAGQY